MMASLSKLACCGALGQVAGCDSSCAGRALHLWQGAHCGLSLDCIIIIIIIIMVVIMGAGGVACIVAWVVLVGYLVASKLQDGRVHPWHDVTNLLTVIHMAIS
jgi:hypothetical protein